MIKQVIGFVRFILCSSVAFISILSIFKTSISEHTLQTLIGLIGLLIISNTYVLDVLLKTYLIREDLKLVAFQDLIFNEIKKNNTQVVNLVVSQAELLSKMTNIAMKNNNE